MAPNGWIVEQALSRAVNDAIAAGCRRACQRFGVFLCECGSAVCLDRCELTVAEYERVRGCDELVVAAGHAAA